MHLQKIFRLINYFGVDMYVCKQDELPATCSQLFQSVSSCCRSSRSLEPLAAMASLHARMEACVPKLQELVKQHNEGTYPWGVEAFNNEIEGGPSWGHLGAVLAASWPHVAKTLFFARNFNVFMPI